MFQSLELLALLPLDLLLLEDALFLLELEFGFHLGSQQDVSCMHEPDFAIVVLEKVTVHLQNFFVAQLLQVEAHLKNLAEAVVFRPHLLQLVLDHLSQLNIGKLFQSRLRFVEELFPVFVADLFVVVG